MSGFGFEVKDDSRALSLSVVYFAGRAQARKIALAGTSICYASLLVENAISPD
jgi:hypothetical protein